MGSPNICEKNYQKFVTISVALRSTLLSFCQIFLTITTLWYIDNEMGSAGYLGHPFRKRDKILGEDQHCVKKSEQAAFNFILSQSVHQADGERRLNFFLKSLFSERMTQVASTGQIPAPPGILRGTPARPASTSGSAQDDWSHRRAIPGGAWRHSPQPDPPRCAGERSARLGPQPGGFHTLALDV